MDWGPFFGWVLVMFALFGLATWLVSPRFHGKCVNISSSRTLTFYGILFFQYYLGTLACCFFVLGLFRDLIWDGDFGDNRQLTFLLAWSGLVACMLTLGLVHKFSPLEQEQEEENKDTRNESTTEADGGVETSMA